MSDSAGTTQSIENESARTLRKSESADQKRNWKKIKVSPSTRMAD